jgi:hypothetical protein
MTNTVYDATVVGYANGDLIGRRSGNKLDRRLRVLEEFIKGSRIALYNKKLLYEYESHLSTHRNDIIEVFLIQLIDVGICARRSTLSRQYFARARRLNWPDHDQHLLAAAIEATRVTIFVTEDNLACCAKSVKREFGIHVVKV